MSEHTAFFVMAFGPGFLAALGVLLLVARWYAERDERKSNASVNLKVHKRVTAAGILLLIPFLFQMIALIIVKLKLFR